MKRIKRIASLVLAMAMAFAMSVTVFAVDDTAGKNSYSITVNQNSEDKTEHIYEAYQIFAGDLATVNGEKVLSNIIWGEGVDGENLLTALKADEKLGALFTNCTTAAQVAEVLSGENFGDSNVTKSTLTDNFARLAENKLTTVVAGSAKGTGSVTITVTSPGYYLVKDQNSSVTTNGAYSRFMLEVVGDATVNVKSEVPSGDKQVYVDNENNADANSASIGSHVSYKITSKVPNHVGYNYYYFIMNDTLSEGLTFDGASSVEVTVKGTPLEQGTDYYVYTGNDAAPKTFRLAFANIMKYTVGDEIVVTYSATVNDKAKVGNTGNSNAWTLQYSNNPDDTFDGERPDDELKPGLPAEDSNVVLGETPEEKALTYVTKLDIIKYANEVGEDHLLSGAEFTLTGTSKQVVLKAVDYYEPSEKGTYYLLLDGTYTETAPTGTEYVEIGVGTAQTTTGYIKEGDNYVVPDDRTQYNGKTLYKLVKGTATEYADVNTKYEKKTATNTEYADAKISIEKTTGEDGKISFEGLGAGTYILTETVTPKGFNTLEPITITISFTAPEEVKDGTEKGTWEISADGLTFTQGKDAEGVDAGFFATNIINNSGSLLPSTGGIGTTIFYVVGAVLVIGAGILLVTKKRMSVR